MEYSVVGIVKILYNIGGVELDSMELYENLRILPSLRVDC